MSKQANGEDRVAVGYTSPEFLGRSVNAAFVHYNKEKGEARPRLFCLDNPRQACGISFYCPIYNKNIYFVQGDFIECSKWIAKVGKEDRVPKDYIINTKEGNSGRCECIMESNCLVIWVKAYEKEDMEFCGAGFFGLLAHELLHAMQYIFENVDIKLSEDTAEVYAYYLQWLMDVCTGAIGYDIKEDEIERYFNEI